MQRSRNTRIRDLPSATRGGELEQVRRVRGQAGGPRVSSFPAHGYSRLPEEGEETKIGRVTTLATRKMIDPSVPKSKRNKAFAVHDRLVTGNPAFVSTVVNLIPTFLGTQDLLEACMMQVSLENNNRK